MPQRFRRLRWVKQWPDLRVLWIEVVKLDDAWRNDDQYFPFPGPYELHNRYEAVENFLAAYQKPIWMPTVSPLKNGAIAFTDGRHRFAWMRDHGVKYMPVGTGPEEISALNSLCGSRSRTCRLPLPIKLRFGANV